MKKHVTIKNLFLGVSLDSFCRKEERIGLTVPSPKPSEGGLRRNPSDLHDWRAD